MENIYINYLLVCISVIMFGIGFGASDKYREYAGSNLGAAILFTFVTALVGTVILFVSNGFKIEFSPISLLIASGAAITDISFVFFSLKALETVNLSLYSLFSMLGGMVLPFIVGIAFFGEDLTVAKSVCIIIIFAALFLSAEKSSRKGGSLYYAGIFIMNGMAGVWSSIYQNTDSSNISSAGYSLLLALVSLCLTAILLPFLKNDIKNITKPLKSVGIAAVGGLINKTANLILVITLSVLPASAQYPMVTGGVIIVSTVIAALGKRKPSKREIISVILAFSGILALVFIPV